MDNTPLPGCRKLRQPLLYHAGQVHDGSIATGFDLDRESLEPGRGPAGTRSFFRRGRPVTHLQRLGRTQAGRQVVHDADSWVV